MELVPPPYEGERKNWLLSGIDQLSWKHMAIGCAVSCALQIWHTPISTEVLTVSHAATTIVQLVIGVGLSLLSGYLSKDKVKTNLPKDRPTTLSQKGSYTPWMMGTARLENIVFGWAGNRQYITTTTGSSLGKDKKKDSNWHEDGWHILGPGPVEALHEIRENGKLIFEGRITRTSHPSGTYIDLGDPGKFYIYWGEEVQPKNAVLAAGMGVDSQWPFVCHLVWASKKLGKSTVWNTIDYVTEANPQVSHLTQSSAQIAGAETLDGPTASFAIGATITASSFPLLGRQPEFQPGDRIRITGNAVPDQDMEIEFVNYNLGSNFHYTTIFPVGGVPPGFNHDGQAQKYILSLDGGLNIAHIWASALFDSFPRGLGLPKSQWDMDSLEAIGVLTGAAEENLICYLQASDGATLEAKFGESLQDVGVVLPIHPDTGRLTFTPLRPPSGSIPRIRETLLNGKLPAVHSVHLEPKVDRVVFSFFDRAKSYRTMTLAEQANGAISYSEFARARTVKINVTNVLLTASSIVSRRSQEELAGAPNAVKLSVTRAARNLVPGQAVVVDVLDDIMLIESVTPKSDSGCADLSLMPDYYGLAKSDYVHPDTPVLAPTTTADVDFIYQILELPELLSQDQLTTVVVPRIRAHSQMSSTELILSPDNTSYASVAEQIGTQTGGFLEQPISNSGLSILDPGPTIAIMGDDIAQVIDLSADQAGWLSGRQLVTIGQEIFFLKKITLISGTQARLDGLVRAVYGSPRESHAVGSKVVIGFLQDLEIIQDSILQPAATIFIKSLPRSSAGQILPTEVLPESLALKGLGPNPPAVSGLRVSLPYVSVPGFLDGQTITFNWGYSTPRSLGTGAGMFPAGSVVIDALAEGIFTLEIYDASDTTLIRSFTQVSNSYQYTAVDRIADHGSESSFVLRVTQQRSGLSSTPSKLTVERLV